MCWPRPTCGRGTDTRTPTPSLIRSLSLALCTLSVRQAESLIFSQQNCLPASPASIELVNELKGIMPSTLTRFFLCNSGSEAVDNAIKVRTQSAVVRALHSLTLRLSDSLHSFARSHQGGEVFHG